MKLCMMALMTALTLTPAVVFAQTPMPGRNDYNINQRKVYQQRRIANGVRSGELTHGETRSLERGERAMRAQDHGRLTRVDRRVIHRQQNRESRRIYRDRHNGRRW